MSPLGIILLIVIVMLLLGAFPRWPHSRGWGYRPFGLLGFVLIVLFLVGIL